MTKKMKTNWKILALFFLAFCFLFTSYAFCQEMPKPGEVIDKTNYKKYAHLIPEYFHAGFENGFGGYVKPISLKVVETKPCPIPNEYVVFSEKNRGKFTIDKDGNIAGGYDLGLPFPEVTKGDKDIAIKLMWNYEYRYMLDDQNFNVNFWLKRRGEPVSRSIANVTWVYFANRLFDAPKPVWKTPDGLLKAFTFHYKEPPGVRNTIMLNHRYRDRTKPDDTYLYLPALRRVLRAEAGQRSTPISGSVTAPDDMNAWDGRTPDFTYQFVGEQKVLGVSDSKNTYETAVKQSKEGYLPFPSESYEIKDCYIIDITSKDPNYPQSKKRIWMDKENMSNLYYAVAWDRAGKVWKIWWVGFQKFPSAGGAPNILHLLQGDLQFGMLEGDFMGQQRINGIGITPTDMMSSNLVKMAR